MTVANESRILSIWKLRTYQLFVISLFFFIVNNVLSAVAQVSDISASFFIGVLINYLLSKPVDFLTHYIRSRALSVAIIYLTFVGLLITLIINGFPVIFVQAQALINVFPQLLPKINSVIEFVLLYLAQHEINISFVSLDLSSFANNLLQLKQNMTVADFGSVFTSFITNSFSLILYSLLSILISIYLLVDGKRVWDLFLEPFTGKLKDHLFYLKQRIDKSLYAFIVGQFQIASLTTLVMTCTYFVLNIPFALVFGLCQMLEVIPVIGTWVAIIPCIILIGFATTPSKALIAFGIYIVYTQIIRDNFVTPRIMGDALGFHPLAIILGLLVAAKLYGAIGIVFALPLMAVIGAAIQYFLEVNHLKVKKI
jgi:predicted PurR-regulated permease PerM